MEVSGSPRPETPDPSTRQGRRQQPGHAQLLTEDGEISDMLEICLKHIFGKYCTPPGTPNASSAGKNSALLEPPDLQQCFISSKGLDAWASDTNGAPFDEATKEELLEFIDVNDDGNLTFKGFMQIYQLQTENDEEETWRDLSNHGFDRTLTLVSTRREESENTAL